MLYYILYYKLKPTQYTILYTINLHNIQNYAKTILYTMSYAMYYKLYNVQCTKLYIIQYPVHWVMYTQYTVQSK